MKVVSTRAELRAARTAIGGTVGLVPTMGALHAGHLSLVREARADNDAVIATIFVNPTQFGPNEDLSTYPRTLESDLVQLDLEGVDLVFTPTPAEMYPHGFQTTVDVIEVAQGLEGERRPGHFKGVATVVTKLFNLTQPSRAYFGQKDAQQVVVIRRMVADLNHPIDVVVVPTLRDADGLALSSRNRYLSPAERAAAPALHRALTSAAKLFERGIRSPEALRAIMREVIAAEPLAELEYVSTADPVTLKEAADAVDGPLLCSLTVRFGGTRLLDNMLLPSALNDRAGLTATLGAI